MCMGGGSPAPPAPPAAPAPPPKKVDPAVVKARQDYRATAALATGRDETVLTSGQGLTTPAVTTGKKQLTGT